MSRGNRDTNLASDNEGENTSQGKTSEHPPGFSATNVAREKPSRKRRLETDREKEFSEKGDDEYADFKRFCAVPKHDKFKWDLPENLAKYTNDHFNKFIPEQDLEEIILVENPVPLNLHPLRKADEFKRDLIFEKRAGSLEVARDSNLAKLQQKLLDVMGPLSKVWTTVEKASNSLFEQVEVSLSEILTKLDQTVMLLGQAFNNISYTRHFNCPTKNYWGCQENEKTPSRKK